MNINATIIVQAFNFFITYWMLRVFLFKPIITLLEHETIQKATLLAIIDQQKTSLAIQEKERQRHWYICQEYFNIHQPYLPRELFFLSDESVITPDNIHPLSNDDCAHIAANIHAIMEEKIKHVH